MTAPRARQPEAHPKPAAPQRQLGDVDPCLAASVPAELGGVRRARREQERGGIAQLVGQTRRREIRLALDPQPQRERLAREGLDALVTPRADQPGGGGSRLAAAPPLPPRPPLPP